MTVNTTAGFSVGNNFVGVISGTDGTIINVDSTTNNIKVKVANAIQEYSSTENVYSSAITTTGGSANINVIPFVASAYSSTAETANAQITSIAPSTFIKELNAFEQKPIVYLYTLYYPGEWYPPNINGNPTLDGAGYAWPYSFPYRFAEIQGDIISDLQYRALFDEVEYTPMPMESSGLAIDSSGKINEITVKISNFDNLVSNLIEDPFLVGNNTANAETAIVNRETVNGIDPRTVLGNPLFDQTTTDVRGSNSVFDYASTTDINGTWKRLKLDTRDLLGAVLEVRTTFANFLDFWPEYSTVNSFFANNIEVITSSPYRVGDNVTNNTTSSIATISSIEGNILILDKPFPGTVGQPVYIVNDDADPESFILNTFKIDSLAALDNKVAIFNLSSWLQFFKLKLPKRKYYKNTCPWVYKGDECQYPENGTDAIPGHPDANVAANGFFTIANATAGAVADDVCAKNLRACELRFNQLHFGGFQGSGRTLPR